MRYKSIRNRDSFTQDSQENSVNSFTKLNPGRNKKNKKESTEYSIKLSDVCNTILPLKFLTCYIGYRAAELAVYIKINELKAQGIQLDSLSHKFCKFLRFEDHLAKLINIQNFEDKQIDELNSFLDHHDLCSVEINLEFIQSN